MEDLKYTPPLEKRCEGVEIFIRSGKVMTKILYAEDMNRERDDFEVRKEVVFSYFGESKIVYPPMPKGIWDHYTG